MYFIVWSYFLKTKSRKLYSIFSSTSLKCDDNHNNAFQLKHFFIIDFRSLEKNSITVPFNRRLTIIYYDHSRSHISQRVLLYSTRVLEFVKKQKFCTLNGYFSISRHIYTRQNRFWLGVRRLDTVIFLLVWISCKTCFFFFRKVFINL